jgi:2-oxoisovalerate dehydrogenase E1 component
MKAAFYDNNPVVMLEHKGLYWSKVPGTEDARTSEPSRDYLIPLGKANIVLHAEERSLEAGETCLVITYGMGVYWAKTAEKKHKGRVEILDLRTLSPLDEDLVMKRVKVHGRCLIITEEQQTNSFAEALAGRISQQCFSHLDAPVAVIGAMDVPAIPMNTALENAVLPGADKVSQALERLLSY